MMSWLQKNGLVLHYGYPKLTREIVPKLNTMYVSLFPPVFDGKAKELLIAPSNKKNHQK